MYVVVDCLLGDARALFGKQFILFIMAQYSFLNTKVAPKIIVDVLVICVKVGGRY